MSTFIVLLKLLLLFIIVPFVELTLLLKLGDLTQWYVPLIVVVISGVAGALLARRQGFETYRRIHEELGRGQVPTDSLLDAVLIFFAGALLLTPGLLTDALGMSLLIPFCRKFYKSRLIAWFKNRFTMRTFTPNGEFGAKSEVIDSYVVDRSTESADDEC